LERPCAEDGSRARNGVRIERHPAVIEDDLPLVPPFRNPQSAIRNPQSAHPRFPFYKPCAVVHGQWLDPMQPMKLFLLLSVVTTLFCAGCTNKYGDDPSNHGLPTPASTVVPTASPIPNAGS